MRRLARISLDAATLLSTILCAAVIVLWAMSRDHARSVTLTERPWSETRATFYLSCDHTVR